MSDTPSIPHNREAEEATIGAVLINPDCYYDVAQIIQAPDFYIHRHVWIWEAFAALTEQRTPLDLLTVTDELERRGRLAEVSPAYLTALINQVPDSGNAEHYAKIVYANSLRRKMIQAANKVAALGYDDTNDAEKALGEAHAELDTITPNYRRHSSPLGDRVFAQAFDASQKGDVPASRPVLSG